MLFKCTLNSSRADGVKRRRGRRSGCPPGRAALRLPSTSPARTAAILASATARRGVTGNGAHAGVAMRPQAWSASPRPDDSVHQPQVVRTKMFGDIIHVKYNIAKCFTWKRDLGAGMFSFVRRDRLQRRMRSGTLWGIAAAGNRWLRIERTLSLGFTPANLGLSRAAAKSAHAA